METISIISCLLGLLIALLCFVGKRFINSVDKLVGTVNDHETRIVKLENPTCEH